VDSGKGAFTERDRLGTAAAFFRTRCGQAGAFWCDEQEWSTPLGGFDLARQWKLKPVASTSTTVAGRHS